MSEKWRNAPLAKAASYIKAETGLLLKGEVSKEVYDQRRQICTGLTIEGKKVSEPCPHFVKLNEEMTDGYCDGCNCPRWKRSQMTTKWKMPTLPCPKGLYPVA